MEAKKKLIKYVGVDYKTNLIIITLPTFNGSRVTTLRVYFLQNSIFVCCLLLLDHAKINIH